jgi:ribosome-associated translation inhibitor RaiA
MTRPVQVAFRNMAASPELEHEVRARAVWLETFYAGLVGCRVLIEIPHRHQTTGRSLHVRVELSLPGEDIVVQHDRIHSDAVVAIHEAFDLARRRLEDYARRQRADVKTHRTAS